ncbi:MAG: CBS domain-containing protein [Planctomycetota bacterium]
MANVQAIVSRKGSQVFTVSPRVSVLDAAMLMNEHKIGALVVLEDARVRGIFTERDVLRRVVAERHDPRDVPIESVMTDQVVTCHAETDLDEARNIFMQRRIRHLPVVDEDNRLVGMISIGDLTAWDLNGQECKIAALEEYLYGSA